MKAYLNGQFMPLSEARISPLDRGFLYSDGVYEFIPVYSRCPFRIDEHLRRLRDSLDGIRLANPLSNTEWKTIILRLIAETEFADQTVYIQVTRGADVKRDPCFPPGVMPTVFLFQRAAGRAVRRPARAGVAAVTAPDLRWARCDIKTIALLPDVLTVSSPPIAARPDDHAARRLPDRGNVRQHVFVVRDGVILTPPQDRHILPGITCDVVLELAEKHKAPYEVRPVSEDELRNADELWLTSSTKEVLAVVTLDGRPVGHDENAGKPGPVTSECTRGFAPSVKT